MTQRELEKGIHVELAKDETYGGYLQLDQLRHYRETFRHCVTRACGNPMLTPLLELLEARLALAIKSGEDDLAGLEQVPPHDADWRSRLARTARDAFHAPSQNDRSGP